MKKFYKFAAISASFFIVGIFTTWFWLQFSQYNPAKATLNDISLLWRIPISFVAFTLSKEKTNRNLKVSLAEVASTSKKEKLVRLRIENMSREAVYFSGYHIESPCTSIVKINNREEKNSCECGTGLGRQILLSGESTVFTVRSLYNAEKVEFGFYFSANNKESKIYWSEPVSLSN